MKPRVVIVGAGLGGCFVAHGLAASHEVTIVELGSSVDLQQRVRDLGASARDDPYLGAGLGGSTTLWHNGLIEIEERVFSESWPFSKSELAPYYEQAFRLLAGVPSDVVKRGISTLRKKYLAMGLPDLVLPGLFYPRVRRNAWKALDLDGRVRVIIGEALALEPAGDDRIHGVRVRTTTGEETVDGEVFVLAAGGLSTPLLLQNLATQLPVPSLAHAGCHYEDHPMAFVAELTMTAPLYRFWNFAAPETGGNLRMPLVVRQDGLDVSFQLRPAANFYRRRRYERVRSLVTEIRNNRFNPLNYARLLTHWDDVLDILSFEFGIRIPTSRYSLYMVAQQPANRARSVWGAVDPETGERRIERDWRFPPDYLDALDRAVAQVLGHLGTRVKRVTRFPNWRSTIQSAAHHSGTARMAPSPLEGVCDANGAVHGLRNLYVADGSLIPGCGIANTGLTIAALALRLAGHLQKAVPGQQESRGASSRLAAAK